MNKFGGETGDPLLDLALARLQAEGWGENWSVTKKRKALLKFGRRASMTANTLTTVWENPGVNEVYLSPDDGNLIDTMSSSSTADVGDTIVYEGHYWGGVNGDELIFATGRSIANGQNKVTLNRPYCRLNRAFHEGDTPGQGDFYFYQDSAITNGVPDDDDLVHLVIKGTDNETQSYKGATSISSQDAWIVTALTFGVQRNQAGAVDFILEDRNASLMQVFRPVFGRFPVNTAGTTALRINLNPPIIIPPNHDVRLVGIASANSITASGTMSGYLAIKEGPLATR
jgi:hypothetical protein